MADGFGANQDLIDTWLSVSFEKKPVALDLAIRARGSNALSLRQRQILPEIIDHSLSALELLDIGWKKRQALWVGSGARSLHEACIASSYVARSEENAERFYQDGLIDIRDIFDSLDAQSSSLGEVDDFRKLIDILKVEMSQLLSANQIAPKAKHLSVADLAKQVGGTADHKLVYQFLSKFSHSTSVAVLTRNGETWLSMVLPILTWIGLKSYVFLLAAVADLCPPTGREVPHE